MQRHRLLAALLILGMTWGITIPLTKIAVSTGHGPLGLIFWQLFFSVIALSAISAVRRVTPTLTRQALVLYLVIGLVGTILPNSVSYVSVVHLPAGIMAIVIAAVPMFTLGIALGLRSEQPSLRRALGVVLGALAVAALVLPRASLPEPDKAIFVLVALFAPFCYGAEGNYLASRPAPRLDPVSTLLGASVIGCALAWPLAVFTASWVNLFAAWGRAEGALLLSSLCHVVAYTGYVWLVGRAGAVFASQIAYIVTISGVFFSSALLGESYSGWVWAALVLMMAGLAMVQPRGARLAVPALSKGE